MRIKPIPDETISRLFPYMRALICLIKEKTDIVSSKHLAEICNINATIIRKDLSFFGEFGKRGIGYDVHNLLEKIRSILKMENIKKVALIGVGNIGMAMISYKFFPSEGFKITVAFDNDEKKIGTIINGITIQDIKNAAKIIRAENIKICILAIPISEVSKIANKLTCSGINAILSFAPCRINMPADVKVTCIDLSTELAKLTYYSNDQEK